jgi:hypothetical protein
MRRPVSFTTRGVALAWSTAMACTTACVLEDNRGPCGMLRTEFDIDGQRGLLLTPGGLAPDVPAPLVLQHHGRGGDWNAVEEGLTAPILTCGLGANGYMIASSHAHGDNWGNQPALDDYVALYEAIAAEREIDGVLILSVSMGGLSGLLTVASKKIPDVRAWAGVYPVTNLGYAYFDDEELGPQIEHAYGEPPPPDHDPMELDPEVFAGLPMLIWASYADHTVPAARHAVPFLARLGDPPTARLIVTEGDHGDLSNFDPAELVAFFDQFRAPRPGY